MRSTTLDKLNGFQYGSAMARRPLGTFGNRHQSSMRRIERAHPPPERYHWVAAGVRSRPMHSKPTRSANNVAHGRLGRRTPAFEADRR